MAIDYGDARTGIAISDVTGLLAGYTTVIQSRNQQEVAKEIHSLVIFHEVDVLVLGYPKNMDGSAGPRAQLCADFGTLLASVTGITPVMWDERLTTVAAHGILSETGNSGKQRKEKVDAVAASLILEGYLSYLSIQRKLNP